MTAVAYLSIDLATRRWIHAVSPSYVEQVPIGAVMEAGAVGRVTASEHPGFAVGDHVYGAFGVQDFACSDGTGVTKLAPLLAPLPTYLGALGVTGLTAYFGLLEIGRLNGADTMVVSGAAGAVGSVAGQIAKIKGCRLISREDVLEGSARALPEACPSCSPARTPASSCSPCSEEQGGLAILVAHHLFRGQLLVSAGSLGCGVSGVVCALIQASNGSEARIGCILPVSWACPRPSARQRPGSVQSRRRCPCPASSRARSASRAVVASTVSPGVPAGMLTVNMIRNSLPRLLARVFRASQFAGPGHSGAAKAV